MGLGEEGSKDQGTRSKGIFSSSFSVTLGSGGGGGSPCGPGGYPTHNGPQYPFNGYPAPAPPPGTYSGYGGHHQPGYNHHSPPNHVLNPASCQPGYNNHSPPHHVQAPPAYGAYPNSYGGHGGGGYGGYGQHHEQHVDYYHRREEINLYQQQGYGGAPKPHGYGKFPFSIRRGISDAKV